MQLELEKWAFMEFEVICDEKHLLEQHDELFASKDWQKGLPRVSENALSQHHDMLSGLIQELNDSMVQIN